MKNKDCLIALKEINNECIDCVITDPPYRIIAWWVRIVNEWDECWWVLQKRDYSITDPKWVLSKWRIVVSDWTNCSNKRLKKNLNTPCAVKDWKMFDYNNINFSERLPDVYRILKKWTHCYIMSNARNLKDLQVEAEKVWFVFQNLLIWDKWNLTPNKYYMNWAEFILMLSKRPARNVNNMWISNILRIKNIIWKKIHPTQKPEELMKILIEQSTNIWDTVLDPFMWVWSTGLWCMELNRNFIWFEIDTNFFNIAVNQFYTSQYYNEQRTDRNI
jgi:site-specific DNA-methyltransferase (adenine-specific)